MVYGLILLNILLLVGGQILWKYGLEKLGGLTAENWPEVALSPAILGGLMLYAVATVIWFIVLSKAKLSMAYPMQSLAYVIGMLAGWAFFKETVPTLSWLGIAFIITGVTIIGTR